MGYSYYLHTFIGVDIKDVVQEWVDNHEDSFEDDWEEQAAPDLLAGHEYFTSNDPVTGDIKAWVVRTQSHTRIDLEGFDVSEFGVPFLRTEFLEKFTETEFGGLRKAKFWTYVEVI